MRRGLPQATRARINPPEIARLHLARPRTSPPARTRLQLTRPRIGRPKITRLQLMRPRISRPGLTPRQLAQTATSRTKTAQPQPARTNPGRQKINQPQLVRTRTSPPRIGQPRITRLRLRHLVRTVAPLGRPQLIRNLLPVQLRPRIRSQRLISRVRHDQRPHPIRRVRRDRSLQLGRKTHLVLRKKRQKLKNTLGSSSLGESHQVVTRGVANLLSSSAGPSSGPRHFSDHHPVAEGNSAYDGSLSLWRCLRAAASFIDFTVRAVRCPSQSLHRKASSFVG